MVLPGGGQPYFVTCLIVADTPGLGPIKADVECVRGIPYRLKITDKPTGKPVVGEVTYFPVCPNPRTGEVPGFETINGFGTHGGAHREADGTYTGGVLPGPGALCVRVAGKRYRPACVDPRAFFGGGAAARPEMRPDRQFGNRDYILVDIASGGHGSGMQQSQYAAIVLTDAPEGSGPLSFEVVLERDPGHTGIVLGPDGRPLRGAGIVGLADNGREPSAPLKTAEFRVTGLNPSRPRRLTVYHDDRRLAGALVVRGDEPEPYAVRLKPWAALTGRLVDADGRPRAGVRLTTNAWRDPLDDPDLAFLPGDRTTDADGRLPLRSDHRRPQV